MQFKGLMSVISLALTLVIAVSLTSPVLALSAGCSQAGKSSIGSKLAPELESLIDNSATHPEGMIRVIIQTRADENSLAGAVGAKGGRITGSLPLVGGYVAEVSPGDLSALASEQGTVYISLDRPTSLLQTRYDFDLLRATTGATNVVGNSGIDKSKGERVISDYIRSLPAGPNGGNISIAILDSGIYDYDSEHEDLRVVNDPSVARVLEHRNFVSNESVSESDMGRGYDPYGHGTHVAGVAAGSGRESIQARSQVGNFYSGMAFNSNLVDLRVIGTGGTGVVSDTIAAINWMIQNRQRYNIRVANFSIGAAVTQSYSTDPLCQAVARAVEAGIVCVVAAGNYGKDNAGNTVYGGILAPANSPYAITVGAVNTQGTAARSDDTIASYSSRGPSLVDFGMKPDLVAPGTMIRSIASDNNYLTENNGLTVYSSQGEDVYMWLSGTSIAAPAVAGTVALMLHTNPGLTPAMVKSILQFTAQPLPSLANADPLVNLLTQGAGNLNVDACVRLAAAFRSDADRLNAGARLLRDDQRALSQLLYGSRNLATGELTSNIAGEIIPWGSRVFYSHGLAYTYDSNLKLSVLKTAGWRVTPTTNLINGYLITDARMLADGAMMVDGRMLADGAMMVDGRMLADGAMMVDGWLFVTAEQGITNPSAIQPTWAANLLDQNLLTSGTFDQRAASESVMVWGDLGPGPAVEKIDSGTHSLFPRAK